MVSSDGDTPRPARPRKIRVAFRRNRAKPARIKDWTRRALGGDDHEVETRAEERVVAKGGLSRRRTIIVGRKPDAGLLAGVVVALRGRNSDVDDGTRIWSCTLRRVLRTRLSRNRHPLAVGDHVRFRPASDPPGGSPEGVIESVEPRHTELRRTVRHRVHTIVCNVDQVIIVSSTSMPPPKPHLIDRYTVAALAGGLEPIVCMNKIDLDADAVGILDRYRAIGMTTLATCALHGDGIDDLTRVLAGRSSAIVGQSGVGKTALLNAVQPGLGLRVGRVCEDTGKGRHTTTTASLIRLNVGGYIVDTPGVRSLDLSTVGRFEVEAHFVEFADAIPNCKFPDCSHTHEDGCSVKEAVERGSIHSDRYASYVRMFDELPE